MKCAVWARQVSKSDGRDVLGGLLLTREGSPRSNDRGFRLLKSKPALWLRRALEGWKASFDAEGALEVVLSALHRFKAGFGGEGVTHAHSSLV